MPLEMTSKVAIMKLCKACDKTKVDSEFHSRAASKDGLSAKCKECQRDYDKSRNRDPKRVMAREVYQKGIGREVASKAKKSWIVKNPKKRKAQVAVGNAIRDGKLTRMPCEVCGATYRIHAHHDDYEKWFDVRWLCPLHHKEWHEKHGEAKNPR
jgi:uncharacterized protein (DUF983 family)